MITQCLIHSDAEKSCPHALKKSLFVCWSLESVCCWANGLAHKLHIKNETPHILNFFLGCFEKLFKGVFFIFFFLNFGCKLLKCLSTFIVRFCVPQNSAVALTQQSWHEPGYAEFLRRALNRNIVAKRDSMRGPVLVRRCAADQIQLCSSETDRSYHSPCCSFSSVPFPPSNSDRF